MGHHPSRGAIVRILMFQQQAGSCFTILEQHWSWVTQERQRRRLVRKWEWRWWQGREEAKERKVWQQVSSFPVISKLLKSCFTFKYFRSASPSPIRKRKDKKRSRSRDRRSRSRGSKSRRSGRRSRSRSRSRSRGERKSKRSRSRGSRRWTNEEEWGYPQLKE